MIYNYLLPDMANPTDPSTADVAAPSLLGLLPSDGEADPWAFNIVSIF